MENHINNYNKNTFSFPKNLTEKQYFIYACFVPDLQSFYKDWVKQKKDRIQFFNVVEDKLIHKYWSPSSICCSSNSVLTNDTIDVKIGYWTPFLWKPIHKDLKQLTMKEEIFDCQIIDSSCNDCKHLDRSNTQCNKLNKKVIINENMCHIQNQNCFEHRKIEKNE